MGFGGLLPYPCVILYTTQNPWPLYIIQFQPKPLVTLYVTVLGAAVRERVEK